MADDLSSTDEKDVLRHCQAVLEENKHGDYTVPSQELYPHQWLWDSCFVAIGLRHYDVERAKKELISLKRGAWSNGMLANIIFNENYLNFDHFLWESQKLSYAPKNVHTTGITQPPMLAESVVKVGEKLAQEDRKKWYESMLPTLINYHSWLYAERDPGGSGLVVLLHPYESGLDNSPAWTYMLKRMRYPWWIHAAHSHTIQVVSNHLRRDTKHVPKSQRIGLIEALECFYALRQLKSRQYKFDNSLPKNQLTVQDLVFNSILVRANKHLVAIAEALDTPLPEELIRSMRSTEHSYEKFWNEERGEYLSINFKSHKHIKQSTIATFLPLYAGIISKSRVKLLVDKLKDPELFNTPYPVPSVPKSSRRFSSDKYWQGPSWINTNWLIIEGLRSYGCDQEARELVRKSINLIQKSGVSEYYSPVNGSAEGAKDFSWTASLTIDLLLARVDK